MPHKISDSCFMSNFKEPTHFTRYDINGYKADILQDY